MDLPGDSFHKVQWETAGNADQDGCGGGSRPEELFADYGGALLGQGMNRLRFRAEEALAEGKLIQPKESGALALYLEMIDEDPRDYFAAEFKDRLLKKMEPEAMDLLRRKDYLNAQAMVDAIASIDGENKIMLHVKERIERQYRR